MIQVDISNIWGSVSLPDLLGLEAEISAAHMRLTEEEAARQRLAIVPEGELQRLCAAAELIRSDSQVLLVLGSGDSGLSARAVTELLRGPEWMRTAPPEETKILFAGPRFSADRWKALTGILEGKDFSLCYIGEADGDPETLSVFRELRWMLERRYGTDEARRRIYLVAHEGRENLIRMAREEDWELFVVPGEVLRARWPLSEAALLPMAAAGIDIVRLCRGAETAREALELRSYENPAWLYAASRNLLGRKGKKVEWLEPFVPGFREMGLWWQQTFACAGSGVCPVLCAEPAALKDQLVSMIRFAPSGGELCVRSDAKDLDGLNALAGKALNQVRESVFENLLMSLVDRDCSVICIDCDVLCEETAGQLLYFLQLSRELSAGAQPDSGRE